MASQHAIQPELVLALVCPLGTPIRELEGALLRALKMFSYDCEIVRVSQLLENLSFWKPEQNIGERARIEHRQDYAFKFRAIGGADALARASIARIRELRQKRSGDPDRPAPACAYVLSQLKHPKEIETLRRVYGLAFAVIAGHAPLELRVKWLADEIARVDGKASADNEIVSHARTLVDTDDKEDNPADESRSLGQDTRDAYPMADYFADCAARHNVTVTRFIELLFGHPLHTPTVDEVAMHQAQSVALRSSDERRQVGAVVVRRFEQSRDGLTEDAAVVASGMNEVPRRGGGYYWCEDSPDCRDQALRALPSEGDREDRLKVDILREIAGRLKGGGWLSQEHAGQDEAALARELLKLLNRSRFTEIGEFRRQVHAEMAAIVDAAMRGVAIRGAHMYVTTFPCHACAKHIIAAGIEKVVYLEPYPKSRATMLHDEELQVDPTSRTGEPHKVLFRPFVGVAPRQFPRLYSMAARGRKRGVGLEEWNRNRTDQSPVHVSPSAWIAYMSMESEELRQLPAVYKWDSVTLCPDHVKPAQDYSDDK